MDRSELAWAAGFFDGEGWANAVGQAGRRTRQPHARVNQADSEGFPVALLRFRDALGGLGRIGGPRRTENRVDLYRWEVSSRRDVERLRSVLEPWLGHVKMAQLAEALGEPQRCAGEPARSDEWSAWAAGFYDGEGSVYLLDHRSHDGYRIAELAITQSSSSDAPEVLQRFAAITNGGHINGPYQQNDAHRDVYRLKVVVYDEIESVLGTIWPWLGPVKRTQAQTVLDVMRSQPKLPRGRPEWGNRKTHCIHGHEYATNRLRLYVPRGPGLEPRDSEQCLQCAREQARVRRAQKKTGDR